MTIDFTVGQSANSHSRGFMTLRLALGTVLCAGVAIVLGATDARGAPVGNLGNVPTSSPNTDTSYGAWAWSSIVDGHIISSNRTGGLGYLEAGQTQPGHDWSAFSRADLSSGTLYAYAQRTRTSCNSDTICDGTVASSGAGLKEKVEFNSIGEVSSLFIPVSLNIRTDAFALPGSGEISDAFVRVCLSSTCNLANQPWQPLSPIREGNNVFNQLVQMTPLPDGGTSAILDLAIEIYVDAGLDRNGSVSSSAGQMSHSLNINAIDNGLLGFHLNFELPDNVHMTSSSGVFLTEVPDAVPEPASLGLLAAGSGVLGFARRRRAIIA